MPQKKKGPSIKWPLASVSVAVSDLPIPVKSWFQKTLQRRLYNKDALHITFLMHKAWEKHLLDSEKLMRDYRLTEQQIQKLVQILPTN